MMNWVECEVHSLGIRREVNRSLRHCMKVMPIEVSTKLVGDVQNFALLTHFATPQHIKEIQAFASAVGKAVWNDQLVIATRMTIFPRH